MDLKLIEAIISRITKRDKNVFTEDLENHKGILSKKIQGKSALIIGGAGTIGFSFIKELIKFNLGRLYVIDTNENGLAEVVRDIRSSDVYSFIKIKTYPFSYANPIFEKLLIAEGPFEIVANFAAHKHVRSEKDEFAIQAMFENNFANANSLLSILLKNKPEHFFCVSTDKATNPVSIMGATKKLMEDIIFSYKDEFNISTARFANVAFSQGSLLDSYTHRFEKRQPIVCPSDIARYFISPKEAGTLCLLACFLGESGDIFFPKLSPEKDLIPLRNTVDEFFKELQISIDYCQTENEAKEKIKLMDSYNPNSYPVHLFKTDTSGEKLYEEFYSENDVVDWDAFQRIGVIKDSFNTKLNKEELLFEIKLLFKKDVDKSMIIAFLSRHVFGFSYHDKGKYLDDKM